MPLKDPEKRKEYDRLRYIKNKEQKKEYMRLQYIKNKEKRKENKRLHYIKNKEKIDIKSKEWAQNNKEKMKEYRQTEKVKTLNRINRWIRIGVICEDFDKLHNKYVNTNNCEWCNKDISKKRYLEHNHSSREVRGIVCNGCNTKIRYKDERYQKCMLDLISLFIK